jgi:hypothetical protein
LYNEINYKAGKIIALSGLKEEKKLIGSSMAKAERVKKGSP